MIFALRKITIRIFLWLVGVKEIFFTILFSIDKSYFYVTGKCIPVIRGGGVYQPAVDLCIEKLAVGDWVHVFPEGKVWQNAHFNLQWIANVYQGSV